MQAIDGEAVSDVLTQPRPTGRHGTEVGIVEQAPGVADGAGLSPRSGHEIRVDGEGLQSPGRALGVDELDETGLSLAGIGSGQRG